MFRLCWEWKIRVDYTVPYSAVKSRGAVSAYSTREQILPFVIAERYTEQQCEDVWQETGCLDSLEIGQPLRHAAVLQK